MHELLLIAQLLAYVPHYDSVPTPSASRPVGTGTLLIAACNPGETVIVLPAGTQGTANAQGIAHVQVPAQASGDDSYSVNLLNGASSRIHGTVGPDETVSGVCP